jgi:hypothetical protein
MLFPTWYLAWPCSKNGRHLGLYLAVVVTALAASAVWLWNTAPPGPYVRSSISKANESEIIRFLIWNFFFAFSPACAFAGWTLARLASESGAQTTPVAGAQDR